MLESVTDPVDQVLGLARRHRFGIGFVVGSIVTAVVAVFIVQNTQQTNLSLLWADFTAALWLFLLAMFIAGAVASLLFLFAARRIRGTTKEEVSGSAGDPATEEEDSRALNGEGIGRQIAPH